MFLCLNLKEGEPNEKGQSTDLSLKISSLMDAKLPSQADFKTLKCTSAHLTGASRCQCVAFSSHSTCHKSPASV